MRFQKRSGQSRDPVQEKSLYPVLYVMDSLKTYHTELVQKEVHSLQELSMVGSSFDRVLVGAESFQEKLQDFGQAVCGSAGRGCAVCRVRPGQHRRTGRNFCGDGS